MNTESKELRPIKLAEADTTIHTNPQTGKSCLVELLEQRFPIQYIPRNRVKDADYLISGDSGYTYEKFQGVRIFTTIENHDPDLRLYDYCLTHNLKQNDRCLCFPFWLQRLLFEKKYGDILSERAPITAEELVAQKREFCNFICRNHVCRERNSFVKHLGERKRVNCPGPFMHNTDFELGKTWEDKLEYQRRHLFTVAYENESSTGYATEKIIDAFVARTIPIYWGDDHIEEVFNPKAFVHARDFKSEKELIDYVLELSGDPERCAAMLNEPVFRSPDVVETYMKQFWDFMEALFRRGPVVQRTRWQRINGVLCQYYGHGLFRTIRRISRAIRGKQIGAPVEQVK